MAPHSSTFAWKIPWTKEPGRLQSMGSLESDTTERLHFHFSLFTFMHWRRKWQPTPVFLLGESQGREAWWAAVYAVAQSWTRLKRRSSSSSMCVCVYTVVVQSLSSESLQLFVPLQTPWTAACQLPLSFIISQSLLRFMFIGLVILSNHLNLCWPLLLLPSVFSSIRVFSNKLTLCIKWLKYWSFSFSPSSE